MTTEKTLTPDILIAGAGIAGATIAAGLRTRGYSVVQLEASEHRSIPPGVIISGRGWSRPWPSGTS